MRTQTTDGSGKVNQEYKGNRMFKRIVLAAIAALLLGLGAALPAQAQVPGKNGLITFASSRDGNSEIYISTRTGVTTARLTNNSAADTDPAFSPDGSKIAFVSDRDGGDREIYVMNADGTDQTRITNHAGDDMDPAWSPDGTKLAIRRSEAGNNEVFLIDAADGGNPVNLTNNAQSDFLPEFSPNGQKVAFQRYSGSGSGVGLCNEVYLMNADGSGQVNLTNNSGSINDGRPSFSPDGTKVAFDSNRNDSRFELYTMDPDGTNVTRLTNDASAKQNAAFSPDGTKIAFGNGAGIGIVSAAGGATSMISTASDSNPNWQLDDVGPATVITSGPADGSTATDPTPQFAFGVSEPESTFECRLDSDQAADWAACDSPKAYSGLTDGEHTFQVRATDVDLGAGPAASRTWTVDTTGPVVTLGSAPSGAIASQAATIEFSVDDETATVECRQDSSDDADWAGCSSPVELSGLAQGDHTFEVRATDSAGNVGDAASAEWKVDTIAPTATFDAAPDAESYSAEAHFEFSADEADVTFECRLDSDEAADWGACDSPKEYSGLADGAHSFDVRATDAAGNVGAPTSHDWSISTAAPVATITDGPTGTVADATASFQFDSDVGTATFECRLDSDQAADWGACDSPKAYSGLTDGEHTFQVRATDVDLGAGPAASRTWTVDTTGPVVTLGSAPSGAIASQAATIEFSVDDETATVECRQDSSDDADWAGCSSPVELSGLAQGDHTFEVRATDQIGNVGEIASAEWTVDTVAPTATIDVTPDADSHSVRANFEFSADEAGATFECRLDSDQAADWGACDSPKAYNGLADGQHNFEVRAKDAAGNVGAAASYQWTVTTVKPVASIDSGPTGTVNSADASFTFSADNPNATFECRLDSEEPGDWAACDSPVDYTGLGQGQHTLEVRATEPDQGTGPAVSQSWTVDTVAPTVTFGQSPPAATSSADASFGFSADDQDATFECRLDSTDDADWAACTSPEQLSGLGEGTHTFEVRATDQVGNVGEVASHNWTIDQTAPTTTIDIAPPDPNNSVRANFEFSADEADVTFECRLDSTEPGDWAACESPLAYDDLTDGSHTFEVRATDAAGNVGDPASHGWEVSTVKPIATIDSGPSGTVPDTSASFTFSADNPNATFQCRLDSDDPADWAACTSPATFDDLADGDHVFDVRATEVDQGTGPAASQSWTVDTITPTVELTGTPAPISGTADPEFAFTASEEGTTAECRLDPADENAPWAACSSPVSYTGLAEGTHHFEVRVTDAAGHVSDPAAYDWIIETTPPSVTITSDPPEDPTTFIGESFEFESTNQNAYFECKFDGSDWQTCESPFAVDQLADGEHSFTVRAVGHGAGPGPEQSLSWHVDTAVPTVRITASPQPVTTRTDAEFGFETNKPGFTFQCSIDGAAPAACSSPDTETGLAPGDHTFQVDALDQADQVVDSTSYEWTILADEPEVDITDTPAGLSGSSTAAFGFATDQAAAGFECQLDDGAWQACTSPVAFTGLADGSHTVRIRTSLPDPPGEPIYGPVADYTWQVDTTAPKVRITGGPSGTVTTAAATFQISSDDVSATTECSIDQGAWVACDDELVINDLADGDHQLRVRSVDQAGNTGADHREWSVDGTAPTATLTETPEASTTERSARFDFSADKAGVVFECRLDGGDWSPCSPVVSIDGLELGAHKFEVRATDQHGNVGQAVTFDWDVVKPPVKGLVPTVKFKKKVRLDRSGTANLARINCPEGSCRVTAPKRATFKVKGKKGTPGIKVIRTDFSGRTDVTLISSGRVRRLVARYGPVKIKLKVKVVSDNGKSRTVTKSVKLTAKK